MEKNAITRLSALAMSTLFAAVATIGVAVMMTSIGEQARNEFGAGIAAQSATTTSSRWQAPAADTKHAL